MMLTSYLTGRSDVFCCWFALFLEAMTDAEAVAGGLGWAKVALAGTKSSPQRDTANAGDVRT